ncbi:hypothetical protein FB451DRAFT_1409420 [Mycena latifolia]|nr:hypothetical protein FB451DRAFT_1409420 [Mycena latifolia]
MHIPFAVFISLALALPTLAAPVVRDVETQDLAARHAEEIVETFAAPVPTVLVGDDSALEARAKTKTKVAAKKAAPVKAKAPAKAKVVPKPKPPPKAKPVPKKAPATAKPAAKPPVKAPVKAKVPAKPSTKAKPPTKAPVKSAAKPPTKAPIKSAAKPPAKAPVKSAAKPPAKAPVKSAAKPPAKAPSKAATGTAPATSACKKPKKGTSAKAAAPKTKAKKGPRRLLPRAVRHPSAKNTISLFHGTTATSAAAIVAQGPQISRTPKGDFNSKPEVDGGFYLSDSLITAAQFACHEQDRGSPAQVDVLEFTWHGSSSVHEFASQTNEWVSFVEHNLGPDPVKDAFHPQAVEIFKNVMVSGPMNGPDDLDLTDEFFQYAVVNQDAANTQLVMKTRHQNIFCANVPKGNSLTDAQYTGTQGGNSQFNTLLATLKQAPAAASSGALCTIAEEDEEE